jgi:hypothetical protein
MLIVGILLGTKIRVLEWDFADFDILLKTCKISTGLGFKFFIVLCLVQMHTVIDEIIFGGQVLETSSTEVMKAIEEISKSLLTLFLSLSCVN